VRVISERIYGGKIHLIVRTKRMRGSVTETDIRSIF
jgi:hypothetical protein